MPRLSSTASMSCAPTSSPQSSTPQELYGPTKISQPSNGLFEVSRPSISKCDRSTIAALSAFRAHVLLCMLAYYLEWHMRQVLKPILFDDHDRAAAEAARTSIVAKAERSTAG